VIIEVKPCQDGKVRSAIVRTSDGHLRERDVRKLVLIEGANPDRYGDNKPGLSMNNTEYTDDANYIDEMKNCYIDDFRFDKQVHCIDFSDVDYNDQFDYVNDI